MNENVLIEKLKRVEMLFAGAATEGEKDAAGRAKQRILDRLHAMVAEEPPIEYRFSMNDVWSRKVFLALLRRYELKPYRYRGQRHTTVMVRVSRSFVAETLWPEFMEFSGVLRTYLDEVSDRVVAQVIGEDVSEATVVDEPCMLEA